MDALTPDVWKPFQDRFGLIHSVLVDPANLSPSTGNGLLYTAEACIIMKLRKVDFDGKAIAATFASCQVKPGLFRRSPVQDDQDSVDDYIGIGALAGICNFHKIARDILSYGEGSDQGSREAVLVRDVLEKAGGVLGRIKKGIEKLQPSLTIPYNYNNVEPGKFTLASWMGRYPALIIHWKLAARIQPNASELSVWSTILLLSAHQNMSTLGQDSWLLSWLMVLTYQTAGFRSAVADAAVNEWWNLLRQRFTGGIKQAMTDYLGGGAKDNPLSVFIDDFRDADTGASVTVNDTDKNPVGVVEGLLSDPRISSSD
jgi:hypothetical protein